MKDIIENQQKSKSSRYCKMIRESIEFSKEEILIEESQAENEADDDQDEIIQGEYESLKNDVLKILQRKIDDKSYKNKIKECKKIAIHGETEQPIGTSFKSLMKTYKKVIHDGQKKWILLPLYKD